MFKKIRNILIAKIELIKLEATLTEMKAENHQRQMQGLSIAYDDFSNIIQTADEIAESLIDKSNCAKDINVPHKKDGNEC